MSEKKFKAMVIRKLSEIQKIRMDNSTISAMITLLLSILGDRMRFRLLKKERNRSIQQKNITIVNMYAPNTQISKVNIIRARERNRYQYKTIWGLQYPTLSIELII